MQLGIDAWNGDGIFGAASYSYIFIRRYFKVADSVFAELGHLIVKSRIFGLQNTAGIAKALLFKHIHEFLLQLCIFEYLLIVAFIINVVYGNFL